MGIWRGNHRGMEKKGRNGVIKGRQISRSTEGDGPFEDGLQKVAGVHWGVPDGTEKYRFEVQVDTKHQILQGEKSDLRIIDSKYNVVQQVQYESTSNFQPITPDVQYKSTTRKYN